MEKIVNASGTRSVNTGKEQWDSSGTLVLTGDSRNLVSGSVFVDSSEMFHFVLLFGVISFISQTLNDCVAMLETAPTIKSKYLSHSVS
ncbi:hypothetical protein TYRP_000437 [Tyrophagus putrescentiae]|nr:hypothetical protein TYRP_000437 [Tyrophagus putrescentiae]